MRPTNEIRTHLSQEQRVCVYVRACVCVCVCVVVRGRAIERQSERACVDVREKAREQNRQRESTESVGVFS